MASDSKGLAENVKRETQEQVVEILLNSSKHAILDRDGKGEDYPPRDRPMETQNAYDTLELTDQQRGAAMRTSSLLVSIGDFQQGCAIIFLCPSQQCPRDRSTGMCNRCL